MAGEQEQDTQKARKMLDQQAEHEKLSFQSLLQEYGDITLPQTRPPEDFANMETLITPAADFSSQLDSVPDGSLLNRDSLFTGGTIMGDELPQARPNKFEKDLRVLGASGGKKTPIWLQVFFVGGLSLLLLLPIVGGSGFVMFQPWYSYVVIFLAAGNTFWSVYGVVHEDEPKDRWLCLIGLAMGLAAIAVAWIMRAPPQF